jgi:2'-5' RNA ligase
VCGFLVDAPQYNDDFTYEQLQAQVRALENANILSFEIEIGGLNSFASAPFMEVHDPEGSIHRLREALANGAREFRTAPYTPHLTVGLYAGAFPSEQVARRLADFSSEPIQWNAKQITLATYNANEFAGELSYKHNISLDSDSYRV